MPGFLFGAQGAIGSQEPLMFVSALSGLTSRIGLIATVSTTFHDPFNLARFFGTLDHVSNGRDCRGSSVPAGSTCRR